MPPGQSHKLSVGTITRIFITKNGLYKEGQRKYAVGHII